MVDSNANPVNGSVLPTANPDPVVPVTNNQFSSSVPPVTSTATPPPAVDDNPFFRMPKPMNPTPTMPGLMNTSPVNSFGVNAQTTPSTPVTPVIPETPVVKPEEAVPSFTMPEPFNAPVNQPEPSVQAAPVLTEPIQAQPVQINPMPNFSAPTVNTELPKVEAAPTMVAPLAAKIETIPDADELFGKPVNLQANSSNQPMFTNPAPEAVATMPSIIPMEQKAADPVQEVAPVMATAPVMEMKNTLPETKTLPEVNINKIANEALPVMPTNSEVKPVEVKAEAAKTDAVKTPASQNRVANLLLLLLVIGLAIASLILGILVAQGQG